MGTSAVKVAVVEEGTGRLLAEAQSPVQREMALSAPNPGWAEQDPQEWVRHVVSAVHSLPAGLRADAQAIGIAYQMHGLVLCDAEGNPSRPSIIWCDSRAGQQGRELLEALGEDYVSQRLWNAPGNFTLAKVAWVARNEPEAMSRWAMLPGDWLAFRLTGEPRTTASGLSEMIGWDFLDDCPADAAWQATGASLSNRPPLVGTFAEQGRLSSSAAAELGLPQGIPVTYRAGDQPNGALALGVMDSGEAAITAGTSGVIYAVSDARSPGISQGVNRFLHGNGAIGTLFCLNGAGSAFAWIRRTLFPGLSFEELADLAFSIPVTDLCFYPFGNGEERILGSNPGAGWAGLDFHRHGPAEMARSLLQGIAFSFCLGVQAMPGVNLRKLRACRANLLLSDGFAQLLADILQAEIELVETNGAAGAARAAGVAIGAFASPEEASRNGQPLLGRVLPGSESGGFARWMQSLPQ